MTKDRVTGRYPHESNDVLNWIKSRNGKQWTVADATLELGCSEKTVQRVINKLGSAVEKQVVRTVIYRMKQGETIE